MGANIDTQDEKALAGPEYVTGRALEPLVSFADANGWEQSELLAELSLTETQARDVRARIPWNTYAAYLDRFERKIGGPTQMHRVSEVLVPTYRRLVTFVGFFASPELIYTAINRWGGPSIFPCVRQSSRKDGNGKLLVELTLPTELAPCEPFFRITAEMFRQAPCMVGGNPTIVLDRIEGHRATYVIDLPPSTTIWARVGRAFGALFSGATVLEELTAQHDRLLESHEQLRQTHVELQRTEANFRSLIEQTPEGVLVVQDERIVYVNAAMLRFLQVEEHDALGNAVADFLSADDDHEKLASALDGKMSSVELRFRSHGDVAVGNARYMRIDWDGRDSDVLVVTDVTERNRVLDRAMQFDRMIAVGTLAAGVAHEISNPVAFVHSNLEYAAHSLDEIAAKLDDKTALRLKGILEALHESLDGTDRVRGIVKEMKGFSRQREEARGPVDLRQVVRSAINMGFHEIRPRAKVRTEYDDVAPVLADTGRLSQVVLNLVVNAAQAMPDREREHNFIRVSTSATEDHGVITVEDNGSGMPDEVRQRVFEPFFTTKPPGEGQGMGLWISANIVRNLGGTLDVESEPGRGTIFRLGVPFAPASQPEAEVAPPRQPARRSVPKPLRRTPTHLQQGRRIMVVDDEPAIGRMVERVFPGEEVLAFTDPHAAIRHLRDDHDFDVVVCDASMSGLNGADFYARLKAEYPDLLPRFLLVTAGLLTSWEEHVPIQTKPSNMEEWRQLVRNAEKPATSGGSS